jgi:hypothetical protein
MKRPMRWIAALAAVAAGGACAFSVSISPGSQRVYLQVGVGSFTGNYSGGGSGANNATVNKVSVTVPASVVGSGAAQQMTSDSTQSVSFYDGRTFCNPPSQVYIGGYVRSGAGNPAASLTVTPSAANLSNASGDTIPFTEISWTASGIGDATQAIPSGSFTGGTQTLASFGTNQWMESCHTFSYANSASVASGTYTGRATYTLSLP